MVLLGEIVRIKSLIILDTAVGYVINKVDTVFVGAEGVVENGRLIGIIRFQN